MGEWELKKRKADEVNGVSEGSSLLPILEVVAKVAFDGEVSQSTQAALEDALLGGSDHGDQGWLEELKAALFKGSDDEKLTCELVPEEPIPDISGEGVAAVEMSGDARAVASSTPDAAQATVVSKERKHKEIEVRKPR